MKHREEIKLPEGVRVGAKPDVFEAYMRTRGGDRWVIYVRALQNLPPTDTLQFDLTNVGDVKKHAKAVVVGIRTTAKKMAFNKKIKYALINNILHITI